MSKIASSKSTIYKVLPFLGIGCVLVIIFILFGMRSWILPKTSFSLTATQTGTPVIPTLTETSVAISPEPFYYIVEEGDTLYSIAQKFNLGDKGVDLICYENLQSIEVTNGDITVGQTIRIPPPGSTLPTSTSVPVTLPRGTRLEYLVLPGDTLADIAARFNSLPEVIAEVNHIEDYNDFEIGDILQIPVNLVTATPTLSLK
jgi:LysM repeat protein